MNIMNTTKAYIYITMLLLFWLISETYFRGGKIFSTIIQAQNSYLWYLIRWLRFWSFFITGYLWINKYEKKWIKNIWIYLYNIAGFFCFFVSILKSSNKTFLLRDLYYSANSLFYNILLTPMPLLFLLMLSYIETVKERSYYFELKEKNNKNTLIK